MNENIKIVHEILNEIAYILNQFGKKMSFRFIKFFRRPYLTTTLVKT